MCLKHQWLLARAHFRASPKTCFFHLPTGPPSFHTKLPKTISKLMPRACQSGDPKYGLNHIKPQWLLARAHFRQSPKTCFFHLPTGAPNLQPNLPQTISKKMPRTCPNGHPKCGPNHNGCWPAPISSSRPKHASSISQMVPPTSSHTFPKPSPKRRVLHGAFCMSLCACRVLHAQFCML